MRGQLRRRSCPLITLVYSELSEWFAVFVRTGFVGGLFQDGEIGGITALRDIMLFDGRNYGASRFACMLAVAVSAISGETENLREEMSHLFRLEVDCAKTSDPGYVDNSPPPGRSIISEKVVVWTPVWWRSEISLCGDLLPARGH